jgi:choline dehydrogenase-like flavoprotein
VFVTDGSYIPSIAYQNPSLTFMALTCLQQIMQLKKISAIKVMKKIKNK